MTVHTDKEILFKDIDLLFRRFQEVRQFSNYLCEPLVTEDYVIQSMPDVSPTKWHLAHTTWFFETFVLIPAKKDYKVFHPDYAYLFNSYYIQAGERFIRAKRGLLSRPTVAEVFKYRNYVDDKVKEFLNKANDELLEKISSIIETGINHEQQHQELLLTDIKHVFSINPLYPVYRFNNDSEEPDIPSINWITYDEGIRQIGYDGNDFAYDNELPQHRVFTEKFSLADRLVTNKEYLEFIEDGGYKNPLLWLSDGWFAVDSEKWNSPLYWKNIKGEWHVFTLSGLKELNLSEPVCHLNYYEADAFARWAGARLPTEAEWEIASNIPLDGNFVESGNFHPVPLKNKLKNGFPSQMFGDVWEWTQSAYLPYPGFKIAEGALGEYNGKFMSNQMVLRGGSCATSQTHIRRTYRNFFPPNARWQFSGIRLAK